MPKIRPLPHLNVAEEGNTTFFFFPFSKGVERVDGSYNYSGFGFGTDGPGTGCGPKMVLSSWSQFHVGGVR